MMYIGTSLGKCLRSILMDEVSEKDVLLIITRTMAHDLEKFIGVVSAYYEEDSYTSRGLAYDIAIKPWEEIEALAKRLYNGGKIHQPRNFDSPFSSQFIHSELSNDIWVEVSPKSRNTTPAVVQAYEHYKLLDSLTQ